MFCSDNRKYVKGHILSAEYRNAKDALGKRAAVAALRVGWKRTDAPLSLRILITQPNNSRRRDLSFSKQAKDAITEGQGVWVDDVQVKEEWWRFTDQTDATNAGAWVSIAPLGPLPYEIW